MQQRPLALMQDELVGYEEAMERMAALVQQLPVGVLLFDAQRKLRLSNERAADLLGKNAEAFDDPSFERLPTSPAAPGSPGSPAAPGRPRPPGLRPSRS